jgi:hypothetical protein
MNKKFESIRAALVERLLCLIVLTSMQLFTSANFYSLFPFDHTILVAKALGEVVTFLVLLRIGKGAVVRDLLNLTFYGLLLRIVLLLAWFTNADFYNGFGNGLTFVITNGLFLTALVRLAWGHMPHGTYEPIEWPNIGPIGIGWPCLPRASVKQYFRVCATFIICFEVAAILLNVEISIYQYIPGFFGLVLVFVYAKNIRESVVETEKDLADQANLLEEYEDVIAEYQAYLKSNKTGVPALKIVTDNSKKEASNNEN